MNKFEELRIVHSRGGDVGSLGMIEKSQIGDVAETIDNLSNYLHNPENFEAIIQMATEAAREKPIHTLYMLPADAEIAERRISRVRALWGTDARRVADVRFRQDDHDMVGAEAFAEMLTRSNFNLPRRFDDGFNYTNEILMAAERSGQDVTIMLQNIHCIPEKSRQFMLPRLTSLVDKSKWGVRQKSTVNVELIATADKGSLPDESSWRTLFRSPVEGKKDISEKKARITAESIRASVDMLKDKWTVDVALPRRSGKSTIAAILRNRSQESIFVINADQLLKASKNGKDLKWPEPRKGQIVFVDKAELLTLSEEEWKKKEAEYGALVRLWTTYHEDDLTSGQ